jgi:hypothetical protein
MMRPVVRIGGAVAPPALLYSAGFVSASATAQTGDSLLQLPFSAAASNPLISRGFILRPNDHGGALIFKRTGLYDLSVTVRACALAGNAGTFEIFEYIADDFASTARKFAYDVDFSSGNLNVVFESRYLFAVSQALLDTYEGSYRKDIRVKTSDAAITWRYGNTTFSSGTAAAYNLIRLGEFS